MPRTERNERRRSDVSRASASDAFVWILPLIFLVIDKIFRTRVRSQRGGEGHRSRSAPGPGSARAYPRGGRLGKLSRGPARPLPCRPPSSPMSLTAAAPFISAAPAPPRRLGRAGFGSPRAAPRPLYAVPPAAGAERGGSNLARTSRGFFVLFIYFLPPFFSPPPPLSPPPSPPPPPLLPLPSRGGPAAAADAALPRGCRSCRGPGAAGGTRSSAPPTR